jgi:hypothetical protein
MPLTQNPFSADPEKAEVFELGYLAGFQDPSSDPFAPFSPELLDAFTQGVDAGREDASRSPTSDPSLTWVAKSDLGENPSHEMLEHLIIEGVAEAASHLFKRAALGLIGVVITALSIEGDTPLQPLEDDFSEPYSGPAEDTNVFFLAACPRTDHAVVAAGVTGDGYWAGSGHNDFGDALREALQHGHPETMVARCSLTDNTCGPVWIAG